MKVLSIIVTCNVSTINKVLLELLTTISEDKIYVKDLKYIQNKRAFKRMIHPMNVNSRDTTMSNYCSELFCFWNQKKMIKYNVGICGFFSTSDIKMHKE